MTVTKSAALPQLWPWQRIWVWHWLNVDMYHLTGLTAVHSQPTRSCCGGDIWWTHTKERQAWSYLQVKLCDPCLITAHVQVIASTLPNTHICRALQRNMSVITTPAWSKRVYCNTIAQLPTCPHHRRRWQHLKGCGQLRAWIRSSEMDITIHSKRVPKHSKQLSWSQIQRNLAVNLSIRECRARYAPWRRPMYRGNQC